MSIKQKKSRYWTFIIYPGSAPDNWIDLLTQTGLSISISPLHDKDINPDGTLKKAHYHVLACWEGPTTYNVVHDLTNSLNSPVPQVVMAVRGMYRYFCHLDNPEKHQYLDSNRTHLNGFDIFNYSNMTDSEQVLLCHQIEDIIIENKIDEYFELQLHLRQVDLNLYNFSRTHTLYFSTFIKGIHFKNLQTVKNILAKKD